MTVSSHLVSTAALVSTPSTATCVSARRDSAAATVKLMLMTVRHRRVISVETALMASTPSLANVCLASLVCNTCFSAVMCIDYSKKNLQIQ